MLWLRPIEATQILSSFRNAGVDRYDGGGGEVLAEVNLCERDALAERPWDPDITDVGEAA
jgi:hypothetical protein